jgi:hypothetical protein
MKIQAIISSILVAWYYIKKWTDKISKVIEPLIIEAEKLAQDGMIDKADRKKLVLSAIDNLEKQGKIKLNFITRFIVSKIVDKIAGKLPDFKISQETRELLTKN